MEWVTECESEWMRENWLERKSELVTEKERELVKEKERERKQLREREYEWVWDGEFERGKVRVKGGEDNESVNERKSTVLRMKQQWVRDDEWWSMDETTVGANQTERKIRDMRWSETYLVKKKHLLIKTCLFLNDIFFYW